MATTVEFVKTIPSTSSWYTSGGATTITLYGVEEINFNTKKILIKIKRPIGQSNQSSSPDDDPTNYVIDLKRIDETLKIRGTLADDDTDTAWEKVWKLRAMCTTGGALTSLTLGNKTFDSSTIRIFLEDLTWTITPNDTDWTVASTNKDIGRIRVDLVFYIGEPK